ncbi:MAG: site-specific DNA-methyltransferase [Chromatiales bacterium]|nr:site-specific DNA-methyltransferase [Chromatiales bacterium]
MTAASKFGVCARVGHDSSQFYNSKKYQGTLVVKRKRLAKEETIAIKNRNKIFHKSSEKMSELPDNSVHLMVTSPPYNVGKEYDNDLTINQYRSMLRKVWIEVHRVLVDGGRACINIANIGRKPYIPLSTMLVADMEFLGFLMRGEIIWDKAASAGTSCAWGSWRSPSNPVLRDTHEYILVFCKNTFSRQKPVQKNKVATISKEQFLEYTKSVWRFPAESARRVGHAAPFPIELPHRLIQLFTYKSDIVLDPFIGSGTTAIAAARSKRFYIGYETEKRYIEVSKNRLKNESMHASFV